MDILHDVYGKDRFDTNDAPIFIAHGTEDPTVAFSNAEELRDRYITTNVDYVFYPLVGRGHGPWNAIVGGKTLEELSFDFIVEQQRVEVL